MNLLIDSYLDVGVIGEKLLPSGNLLIVASRRLDKAERIRDLATIRVALFEIQCLQGRCIGVKCICLSEECLYYDVVSPKDYRRFVGDETVNTPGIRGKISWLKAPTVGAGHRVVHEIQLTLVIQLNVCPSITVSCWALTNLEGADQRICYIDSLSAEAENISSGILLMCRYDVFAKKGLDFRKRRDFERARIAIEKRNLNVP